MSTRLEQFIRENREQFDTEEPGSSLWNNIQEELKDQRALVNPFRKNFVRWSAAAAVIVLALAGIFFLLRQDNKTTITQTNENLNSEEIFKEINPAYAQEVFHFTRIIELKQTELKQIQKDQPELYEKFIGDITKLNTSFNALKRELPANPNREQLLEAMIQNLRLQTELLNQQLLIIQQIRKAKNTGNENNSKNI